MCPTVLNISYPRTLDKVNDVFSSDLTIWLFNSYPAGTKSE